jgi:aryl-alcohol dehydrogenase-like predicted oxidoreductase
MDYRYLGKTGLQVSELCLGTLTLGREATTRVSRRILHHFAEAGGNFIDTANTYRYGAAEEIVGRWLKEQSRHQFVIATKVRWSMGEGPNDAGLSRKHILDQVDASLRRLGTDYIDLYQIHAWDQNTPLEETLDTLDSLVKSGKVRYLGASNCTAWQLQKALDLSKHMGWERFCCFQGLYNLLDREIEWGLVDVCVSEGVAINPYSPLRGGWLSGKYRRGMTGPPKGTRVDPETQLAGTETWERYNNERTWRVIDELTAVAEEVKKTPAQVAINWLLQQPGVTAPIIGARNLTQLKNNLGATGWWLSEEHLARLTEVSGIEKPYPYWAF